MAGMRTFYTEGRVRVDSLTGGDAVLIEHSGHSEWRQVLDVWTDLASMRRHFGENSPLVKRVEAAGLLESRMYVVVRYMVEEESATGQSDSFIIRRRIELVDIQVPIE